MRDHLKSKSDKINAQFVHSAKPSSPKVVRSRTDFRYWLDKVKKPESTSGAKSPDYSVQIAYRGKRVRFPLRTPVKDIAANRAKDIYLKIIADGWDAALANEKPTKVATKQPATIGTVIEAATRLSSARSESLDTYSKALRRIAGQILKIDGGKRFDAFKGGNKAWKARVDATPLLALTPSKIVAWKNEALKTAPDQESRQRLAVTLNSLIRNAKALFSKRIRPFLADELDLPSPLFFEGVGTEKQGSLRYRSTINAKKILKKANEELRHSDLEAFKALVLCLVLGLRRSEADWLCWNQFDFKRHIVAIKDTEYKRLKSADSADDLDIDPPINAILSEIHANATDKFVLETPKKARLKVSEKRKARCYRANATFQNLIDWLRAQGVNDPKPLHTLRKEIGSIIASEQGIWQASRFLRHSDIRITSAIYTDKKLPVTSGLGGYL